MRKINSGLIVKKIIIIIVLFSIAVFSNVHIAKQASNPEKYAKTINSIDEKKATVAKITFAAGAASIAIAAIPSDATTPLAEIILDVTSYLVIALCALVLEKTLLTALGWFVFAILIPVVCGILILYFLLEKISFKALAIKLLIFSLIIQNIIPLSIKLSDIVYQSNQTNIEQMEDIIKNNGVVDEQKTEENESWFSPIKNKVLNGFSELSEDMKAMFNIFIDSVAVMLLTTCIIPFLVVVIVLWLVKYLFNFNISFEKGIATLKTLSKIKKNEQNE